MQVGDVSQEGLHFSRRASMLPVPRTAGRFHLGDHGESSGGGCKRPTQGWREVLAPCSHDREGPK